MGRPITGQVFLLILSMIDRTRRRFCRRRLAASRRTFRD